MGKTKQLVQRVGSVLIAGTALLDSYVSAQESESTNPIEIRSAYNFSPNATSLDFGIGHGIMDEGFKFRRTDDRAGNTEYLFGARFNVHDSTTLYAIGSTKEDGVGLESKTTIGDSVLDFSLARADDSFRVGYGLTFESENGLVGAGADYIERDGDSSTQILANKIYDFSEVDRAGIAGVANFTSDNQNTYSLGFFSNHAGPDVAFGHRLWGRVDVDEKGEISSFGELLLGGVKRGYADFAVGRTSNNGDLFTKNLFTGLYGLAPIDGIPFQDRFDDGLAGQLFASHDGASDTTFVNSALAYVMNFNDWNIVPMVSGNFDSDGLEKYHAGLQVKADLGDFNLCTRSEEILAQSPFFILQRPSGEVHCLPQIEKIRK